MKPYPLTVSGCTLVAGERSIISALFQTHYHLETAESPDTTLFIAIPPLSGENVIDSTDGTGPDLHHAVALVLKPTSHGERLLNSLTRTRYRHRHSTRDSSSSVIPLQGLHARSKRSVPRRGSGGDITQRLVELFLDALDDGHEGRRGRHVYERVLGRGAYLTPK